MRQSMGGRELLLSIGYDIDVRQAVLHSSNTYVYPDRSYKTECE